MAEMRDADRSRFSDAYKGTFDFSDDEVIRIGQLAAELDAIMKTALNRQKEKIEHK
jgi:hypothetical protein